MGVRADLEHRLRRRALRDAAFTADEFPVAALRDLGAVLRPVGCSGARGLAIGSAPVDAPCRQRRVDACGLPGRRVVGGETGGRRRYRGPAGGAAAGAHRGVAGHHVRPWPGPRGRTRMGRSAARAGRPVAGAEWQVRHWRGHALEPGAGGAGAAEHHQWHAVPEALRLALRRAHRQRRAVAGGAGREPAVRAARDRADALAPAPGGRAGVVSAGPEPGRQLLAVPADPARRGPPRSPACCTWCRLAPALLAWLLFGESFTATMLLGLVVTVAGVAMVVKAPAAAPQ